MEVTYSKFCWDLWKMIIKEGWKGKTLPRILMNRALSSVEVSGNILDLGSSSEGASYNRFIVFRKPYQVTYTDFYHHDPKVVMLDLEKAFPLENNSFDHITCFNTLEHIYNYENVVRESARVLKKGGLLIGATPFLVNYHPDPHDFFRYTHEAVERIFVKEGFVNRRMVMLGLGPFSAGASLATAFLPAILRFVMLIPALVLDWLVLFFRPSWQARFPLGYLYLFQKE